MINDLRVSLIQSPLHWENAAANLAMFEEKIWQIDGQTDLIILPETFTTGFTTEVPLQAEIAHTTTFRWMAQQAAQTKAVVMGSYLVKDGSHYHNRLYVINPDGSHSFYDKRHLFSLAGEHQHTQCGLARLIVDVKGWSILPLICYDLRFPVWSRSQKSEQKVYEYDLVVYVANWPKPRINAWDTLLAARAIENQSYAIGVNRLGTDGTGATYVGHTSVYDFLGEQQAFSDQEEIIQVTLHASALKHFRNRFPFQVDGEVFTIGS